MISTSSVVIAACLVRLYWIVRRLIMSPALRVALSIAVIRLPCSDAAFSSRARKTLVEGLRAIGAEVTRVDAYSTEIITEPAPAAQALAERGEIGAVMLASPSAVEGFVAQLGSLLPAMSGATFVAIGSVTAEAMRRRGLPVHATPDMPGAQAMVEALARYLWGDAPAGAIQRSMERA